VWRTQSTGTALAASRYPNVNLTAYGLLDLGQRRKAQQFIAVVLRDVLRAGSFGEVVSFENGVPVMTGVQESLFSPLIVIEFTWLLNGCRYDAGTPIPLVWAR